MQVQTAALEISVSTTDYVIDILLISVIFRQVRPHELTPRAALPDEDPGADLDRPGARPGRIR